MFDVIGRGGPAPRARCPDQSCTLGMQCLARSHAGTDDAGRAAAVGPQIACRVWPLGILVASALLVCVQPPARAQEHVNRCTAARWTSPKWIVPAQPLLAAIRYPDLAIGRSAISVAEYAGSRQSTLGSCRTAEAAGGRR